MRRATIGLAGVLLTVSCGDACWQDDYDFVWHGEHVTVYGYGYTEADACGGSFTEIDGHTGMIMDELGIHDAPPSLYRWLSSDFAAQLDDTPCGGILECAWFGEAMSLMLPNMHEVVHTVEHHIGGDGCPRALSEGLAMYHNGPSPSWHLSPTADYGIRVLLEDGGVPLDGPAYVRAAHFVSYLIENYGPESVVELCEALPREPAMERWEEAIPATLGITLDQLLADYESYPQCSYPQMRARLWGCSGPADFTFTAKGDEFVVEAGCEDPQATNAVYGSIGDALLLRRVYFTEDRRVRVWAESLGTSGTGATVVTQECAACSEDPDVEVGNSEAGARLYRAGMHEVSVFFDKRDKVRLTMAAVY